MTTIVFPFSPRFKNRPIAWPPPDISTYWACKTPPACGETACHNPWHAQSAPPNSKSIPAARMRQSPRRIRWWWGLRGKSGAVPFWPQNCTPSLHPRGRWSANQSPRRTCPVSPSPFPPLLSTHGFVFRIPPTWHLSLPLKCLLCPAESCSHHSAPLPRQTCRENRKHREISQQQTNQSINRSIELSIQTSIEQLTINRLNQSISQPNDGPKANNKQQSIAPSTFNQNNRSNDRLKDSGPTKPTGRVFSAQRRHTDFDHECRPAIALSPELVLVEWHISSRQYERSMPPDSGNDKALHGQPKLPNKSINNGQCCGYLNITPD